MIFLEDTRTLKETRSQHNGILFSLCSKPRNAELSGKHVAPMIRVFPD